MSTKEIPFGKVKDNKIYLAAWGDFEERIIGEIRNSEEDSIQYFEDRFKELEEKINQLEKNIEETQNKGSFLMKLVHLKNQLNTHDGLGDYAALQERLEKQEALLNDIIEKNREKNTEIKTALIQEMKEAVGKINWKEATEEIHDIKARWIKTGNPKEELIEEMEGEFWGMVDAFFEKKKQFYEDKKLLGEKRKKAYEAVVKKAEQVAELHGKARFDLIKSLKEEWKEIGNIQKEDYSPLFQAFNAKLKAKRQSFSGGFKIDDILTTLDNYTSGEEFYGFKQLEELKNKLKQFRPTSYSEKGQRQEAFQKIQLLMERDFLDKLAFKRFKNFKELEKSKKLQIRIGILEELIGRDMADLSKYQENSANFSSSTGGMISMVEKKIQQQKSKIEVKERLLAILKADS